MKKQIKIAFAIIYLASLIYLVFFARRREAMQERHNDSLVNLVPVINQVKNFQSLNPNDPREEKNFIFNLVGNVLLFVPFSPLLISFGYKNEKKILFAALATSCFIEMTQYIFVIGVADVDDVLLNLAGAYAGLVFLRMLPDKTKAMKSASSF